MSEYEVKVQDGESGTIVTVSAERFEIENGVLVFYGSDSSIGTLADMTANTRVSAFNNWEKVERV